MIYCQCSKRHGHWNITWTLQKLRKVFDGHSTPNVLLTSAIVNGGNEVRVSSNWHITLACTGITLPEAGMASGSTVDMLTCWQPTSAYGRLKLKLKFWHSESEARSWKFWATTWNIVPVTLNIILYLTTASSLNVLGRCAILWNQIKGTTLTGIDFFFQPKIRDTKFKRSYLHLNCQWTRLKCKRRYSNYQAAGKRILSTRRGLMYPFCNHNTTHPRSQFAQDLRRSREELRPIWLKRRFGHDVKGEESGNDRGGDSEFHGPEFFFSVIFGTARKSAVIMQNEEGSISPVRILKLGWVTWVPSRMFYL